MAQWPETFNSVDGRRWRVFVRSFTIPSSTPMSTPWAELRLRVGAAASYNSNCEHGVVSYVIQISAVTGQQTEAWTEVQSLEAEIVASLHDSDGNLLAYQAPDKTISQPGEWIVQIEFQPTARLSC